VRRPSLRDRAEYGFFRIARSLLGVLPERAALAVGSLLGWCAGGVFRIRRRVVDENLLRAFPDRDDAWRRRVARASYRHLGREAVATLRFSRQSAADVIARTEVHGFDQLERAVVSGPGAIVVTGHLGNWEMGGAALAARGIPVDAVAVRQRNRLFDADLMESRTRLGMRVIRRGTAARDVFESLRERRCPALVADQDAPRRGLFVDFFGVPASTARGPAVFSLRSGAPIFLGVALAVPGKRHHYRIELHEVAFEPQGDLGRDVGRLTAAHTLLLERWVRTAPHQYFWQHQRWKRSPGGGHAARSEGAEATAHPEMPRNRSRGEGL
jgi:KDO2-lipid IV(A) lauroyltransferase